MAPCPIFFRALKTIIMPNFMLLTESEQVKVRGHNYVILHRAYITGALVAVFHEVHTDSSEAPYLNTGEKILRFCYDLEK